MQGTHSMQRTTPANLHRMHGVLAVRTFYTQISDVSGNTVESVYSGVWPTQQYHENDQDSERAQTKGDGITARVPTSIDKIPDITQRQRLPFGRATGQDTLIYHEFRSSVAAHSGGGCSNTITLPADLSLPKFIIARNTVQTIK